MISSLKKIYFPSQALSHYAVTCEVCKFLAFGPFSRAPWYVMCMTVYFYGIVGVIVQTQDQHEKSINTKKARNEVDLAAKVILFKKKAAKKSR